MKHTHIDRRLHALEQQWARQMARRLMGLPPRKVLAALLDVAPEDLPPDGSLLTREDLPEALRPVWDAVGRWTPQEEEAHLVQMLTRKDDAATQRLLALEANCQ